MSRDELVFVLLVLSFASFMTAHVALCLALASREPRVRALMGFVLFPLAPYWGARDGQRKRALLWVFFAVAYVALRIFSR
jgi:hypothetical protein